MQIYTKRVVINICAHTMKYFLCRRNRFAYRQHLCLKSVIGLLLICNQFQRIQMCQYKFNTEHMLNIN
jgi:hypothetical protein